ncbi:MAG: bifunctional diguanylate cyclase/phosphodiesterase [Deltaproteobacteria bacterium]|nr:bifunctional diguanylate cyclase/phosphodiesterase [Deltaproteobacteria bacterium]
MKKHNLKEIGNLPDKNISVDRDILESEVKLLERSIITSDVIRNWKGYIKHLLVEINKVVEVYNICSIFYMDDGKCDVEIFWLNTPSIAATNNLKKTILENIKGHFPSGNLENDSIRFTDNIVGNSVALKEVDENYFHFKTTSACLETDKICGTVGIGIHKDTSDNTIVGLVLESILITLLNVMVTVKAVDKYTNELKYYATRDPLTHLYNQRVFWELLHYETERSNRHNNKFSLMVIDIDDFKSINDVYGHSFGDKILKEYTRFIREMLRGEDLFARYGGDEFVVILPNADIEQAYSVAERINDFLDKFPLTSPDGNTINITSSIGISVFPDNAKDSSTLFSIAENMMYRVKSQGRNGIGVPRQDDVADIFKRLGEKSIIITRALAEKSVIPYFQPVMNLETGNIEANELLMRIPLNNNGIMNAGEFIEMAENMGVINELDYILMEKTFKIIREVNYQGIIFINLSPKILIVKDFIYRIGAMTSMYGVDVGKIVFEITERGTVRNIKLIEKYALDLKSYGFKFAIDDFGSGFSSFQYIKKFPIDYVKLDGEFIKGMINNHMDKAIVLSMVTLAKELGIKTIAEFVEDKEILTAVSGMDIDYVQGYYIGMPSPVLQSSI